jgi:hypothetical protein
MNDFTLKAWAILLALPIIPVVLLYWFFGSQNYFNLTNTAKGLVMSGPIGAYILIVWMGWNIFARMLKTIAKPNDIKKIKGDWEFTSKSNRMDEKGNSVIDERKGTCKFVDDMGTLKMTGSFTENDKPVGSWESEMCKLDSSMLKFSYILREIKGTTMEYFDGLCVLSYFDNPHKKGEQIEKIEGIWVIIGRADMAGEIKFTKVGQAPAENPA